MGNTNPNFIPLSLTSLQRVLKPSQNPSLFSSFFHFQTSMSNMQFWGVEVKAGEPLKVEPDDNTLLHLSQAALGEPKKDKGSESVVLSATVNGQKLVIGTLSTDKCPQISYDLVFEKEFELSHNWKNGSVFFCGYKADAEEEGSDGENMFGDDSEFEEEEIPVVAAENGKHVPKVEKAKASDDKAKAAKPVSAAAKPKVETKPSSDEEDDSEDEDDSEEDESEDEDMLEASDDSDEDSSEEEEEEEATPENAKQSKKRPAVSATKTSAPEKKAKLVTPQKSGGDAKKGNTHTATPHPSKQAAKTKGSADKSKQQTPKSAGQVSCKSCSKTFNSDGALQSHTKAKHSDGK
ncbi:hypothetical protein AQUCO_00900987v1 [Aquilegia coerulea]|uniref:C2H2-type domain-containing protein n=1 Tax=Aquilegia coerulea TaxID=218851 RepID=A0A2G5EG91_AQUCA|nr:hypothetical protein AQUCO_00900987v1 [Aquilegia coerulea]